MDNDSKMLNQMGTALVVLQVKYRAADFQTQEAIEPELLDLMDKYASFQIQLIKAGIITTDDDLAQMADIRQRIDQAAEKQALLLAIARTAFFIASKV